MRRRVSNSQFFNYDFGSSPIYKDSEPARRGRCIRQCSICPGGGRRGGHWLRMTGDSPVEYDAPDENRLPYRDRQAGRTR
jgi:hypothetical protein